MKKILTSLALGLISLVGISTAQAASLDGPIQLNTVYEGTDLNGSYTATSAGTLTISYNTMQYNNLYPTQQDAESETNQIKTLSSEWNFSSNVFGTGEAYEVKYALNQNQTVYFKYYDFLTQVSVYFSFEGGEVTAPEPYAIVSMTVTGATVNGKNMTIPSSEATMPVFLVTLNKEYTYEDEGQQPSWEFVDSNGGGLTYGTFVDDGDTTDKVATTNPKSFELYGENLTVGQSYTFKMTIGSDNLTGDTYTIVNADGSTTPETGEFTPMTTENITLDQAIDTSASPYSGFTWETSGDISGPSNCYVFTAEQNGTLVIVQSGESEAHLYSLPWNQLSTFNPDSNIYPATEVSSDAPYKLTYIISQGNTYYFYARISSSDRLSSMYYTWTPSGTTEDIPSITEGSQFSTSSSNSLYKYIPSSDGQLNITVVSGYNYNMMGENAGQTGLLFTDLAHNSVVPLTLNSAASDDVLYTNVTGGQTYYLFWESSATFVFNLVAGEIVESVTSVNPEPGSVIDYKTQEDIIINASANIEGFTSVTLTYNDQTIDLTDKSETTGNPSFQFLQIGGSGTTLSNILSTVAQNASEFTITVEGLTAGGVLVSSATNDYNGNLTVSEGTVTLKYYIDEAPEYLEASSTWPETFLSYWAEGAAGSTAALKFNMDVTSVGGVTVWMGNTTPDNTSETPLPSFDVAQDKINISGSTVTIDFAGVERKASNISQVTIFVSNVAAGGTTVNFGEYNTTLVKNIAYEVVEVEEPTAQEIEPEVAFEVEAEGEYSTGHPLWVYTPDENIDNYYFTVADYEYNVFEGLDSDSPALVVFSTDPEGNNKINLTAVETNKGDYVYTGENLEANQNYYIVFIGEYQYLNMTLVLAEYIPEAGPQYGQIELNVGFTPDSATPTYSYNATQDLDEVSLNTEWNVNLIEEGTLTIELVNYGDDTSSWTAVRTEKGWSYNGIISAGWQYLFTYTGSTPVEFTLSKGSATAAAIDNPEIVYDNEEVYLVFSETIHKVNPDLDIEGYFTYPGYDAIEGLVEILPGEITTYDSNSEGLINNAIKFDVADLISTYGNGKYSVTLYGADVETENFAQNVGFTLNFTVGSDAINGIGAAIEEGAVIYNLQGQKVANPAKGGIYIINGKKVLVK